MDSISKGAAGIDPRSAFLFSDSFLRAERSGSLKRVRTSFCQGTAGSCLAELKEEK